MKVNLDLTFLKFELTTTAKGIFAKLVALDEDINPVEILTTKEDGADYLKTQSEGKKQGDKIKIVAQLPANIKALWV